MVEMVVERVVEGESVGVHSCIYIICKILSDCITEENDEKKEADVGLTGASPNNLIYISGEPDHKVSNQDFIDHLESVIRDRAEELEVRRASQQDDIIYIANACY